MNQADDHIERELPAYLEGSVSAERKKIIEDHLERCEQCSSALREWRQVKEAIGTLEHVEPPPWLVSRIMHRIREQKSLRQSLFDRLFFPFHIKIPVQVAATCVIAIMVLFLYNHIGPGTVSGPEDIKDVTIPGKSDVAVSPAEKGVDKLQEVRSKTRETTVIADNASSPHTKQGNTPIADNESGSNIPEKQFTEQKDIPALSLEKARKENAPAAANLRSKSAFDLPDSAAVDRMAAQQTPSETVVFVVATDSLQQTVEQVRDLLARHNTKNTAFSLTTHQTATLTGEIPLESLQVFSDALAHLVNIREHKAQLKGAHGYISVRIDILRR